MLTAKDAREISICNSDGIQAAMKLIEAEAKLGNVEVNIGQGVMEHSDAGILRALGYSVVWNRPCLWWEVSWRNE